MAMSSAESRTVAELINSWSDAQEGRAVIGEEDDDDGGGEGGEKGRTRQERVDRLVRIKERTKLACKHADSITTTLDTFYTQLMAVSHNIESLQTESSRLQVGLHNRRQVAQHQASTIDHLVPPASMVELIVDGKVGPDWLPQIIELDTRLAHSGQDLGNGGLERAGDMLDMLRIKMREKIRSYFMHLIKAITVPGANVTLVQRSRLLPVSRLFHFCQQHLPRVAHEIQVTYVAAMSWFIKSHFQSLIQALRLARDKKGLALEGLGMGTEEISSDLGCRPGSGPMDADWRRQFEARVRSDVRVNATLESKNSMSHELCFNLLNRALLDHISAEWDFVKQLFNKESHSEIMTQIYTETLKDTLAFTEKLYPVLLTRDTISIMLSIRTVKHLVSLAETDQPAPLQFLDYSARTLMILWPVYQKNIEMHCLSIVKCQKKKIRDDLLTLIVDRYTALSSALMMLCPKSEEMMVLTGLHRLRKEMTSLIQGASIKQKIINRVSSQLQECVIQFDPIVQDRLEIFQSELAYWTGVM